VRFHLHPARSELSRWQAPVTAAALGWLLACALLVAGVRPLGWVLLAALVMTLAAPAVHAGRAGRPRTEATAFTLAAVMLSWPPLAVVTLLVFSWTGALSWQ
jgi:uncharacterized membrane protein YphA (DoxX/SURF4 family)